MTTFIVLFICVDGLKPFVINEEDAKRPYALEPIQIIWAYNVSRWLKILFIIWLRFDA